MFKDWCIHSLCEFTPNKILVTTIGHCMFIIDDFYVTKFIESQNSDDAYMRFPHPLPSFDEENFPFILLSGSCLNIFNIKEGFTHPFIN